MGDQCCHMYEYIYLYIYTHTRARMCVCVCVCVTILSRLCLKLAPWSRVLVEKLTGSQLVKKVPALYGIAFTRDHHLSLFGARPIQSMPTIPLPEDPF